MFVRRSNDQLAPSSRSGAGRVISALWCIVAALFVTILAIS
jgi:hypothetical protein